MKNPFREYKRLQRIVDYYENNMLDMMRCQKYAELGLLLLSNVKQGDIVYLIGSKMCIFRDVCKCRVEKIEFIGQNDAIVFVKSLQWTTRGEMFQVRNRQFGKLFFLNRAEAYHELRKRWKEE